ncbi:hypothetical protein GUITHDRAFT_135550 [Guillardia theta CCMP2712]|uniref:Sugar phosphate phosphatase n=1 Tax=Guillardia theta (strain CCMP2712) TaxID=905079 RepID=L1JN34_GUITC|nr:hypothetical protein GUITHDRAFT_135550 [Guillardia theta CCMP2712]EKX49842.1 hypothetical protein GUITHDRAFT_135550 [Guillardia theta CCMP2712]|eukprot:XP_005836822.1 hypothetical protein GUITHDRAFT_135550 [Guillardia theta CCMP2712]
MQRSKSVGLILNLSAFRLLCSLVNANLCNRSATSCASYAYSLVRSHIRPSFLDPQLQGSFARHTLLNRLSAVANRLIKDGVVDEPARKRLASLADEVPTKVPLRAPLHIRPHTNISEGECGQINEEWKRWLDLQSSIRDWSEARPLISTEMYFHRRVLDEVGYFDEGPTLFRDPFESQKVESIRSALASSSFLQTVQLLLDAVGSVSREERLREYLGLFMFSSLWGNQGDLALAPLDAKNVNAAETITSNCSSSQLVVNHLEEAVRHISGFDSDTNRIDFVLDNSGIELFCDLVLTEFLLSYGFANKVDMHITSLENHDNALLKKLGLNLRRHVNEGLIEIQSHMFWTSPRLFWEMPSSLAQQLRSSSLVIVKGDANYRRLIGDRQWPCETSLQDIVKEWFPSALLMLRTMKCEIAVGINKEKEERLFRQDPSWQVTGKYGSIQFVRGGQLKTT